MGLKSILFLTHSYLSLSLINRAFSNELLESIDTKELDKDFANGTFRKGFIWSTASAAYQIEGAWNASVPNPVANHDTGDVACDSYHLWQDDIKLIRSLGTKYYRLSISWPRILPTGLLSGGVNEAGVKYYQTFFGALIKNGIQPMVTMYHWDLPQHLQDMGGWLNDSSPSWFLDYARLAFTLFGNQVKYWLTFNEPFAFIPMGCGNGEFAPKNRSKSNPGTCPYVAGHNVIKAHSKVWHLYDKKFRPSQKGKISITLSSDWCEPLTNKTEDKAAAERCMQFMLGWFANPIFNNGDYPAVMKDLIAARSRAEGLNTSRLPAFTPDEMRSNKGTFDFFGLNHYTTGLVFNVNDNHTSVQSWEADQETNTTIDPSWPRSGSSWLYFVPWGMRKILNWIRITYNNPPVIVTENGWSDLTGTLNDTGRIRYYKYYINNALKAYQDGCNIIGYTAWSIMDNFEWLAGYTVKFGLNYVNFSDPGRPRIAKASMRYYASIIANNGFPTNSGTSLPQQKSTSGPIEL